MVSTRQMATSGGGVGAAEDPPTATTSAPRLTVVTRQTGGTANGASSSSSSSTSTTTSVTTRYGAVKSGSSSPSGGAAANISSPELNLLDLPLEILSKIVSYMGYKRVGQLRAVSPQFNQVCMHILNSTFSKVLTQTFNHFHTIKAKLPRRESARRTHPLACECDIVETCYMRLSLLQMTFGKHIERGHCCFFPGGILDEVYIILNYIKNTPDLDRPYRVTDELFDLSTMAMEYFKDSIEPTLPGIGFFSKSYFNCPPTTKRPLVIVADLADSPSSMPSPPQSNMVLRKGIRKIKQGMKIYNNQLSVLRNELRTCKRKSAEQGKQMTEQQKLLADQQKQTVEYANRLDENDKKNEEMARKFSTLLQELNKFKTELQYWRSKSPAIPTCTSCGQKVAPVMPTDELASYSNADTEAESENVPVNAIGSEFALPDEATAAKLLAAAKQLKRQQAQAASSNNTTTTTTSAVAASTSLGHITAMDCLECGESQLASNEASSLEGIDESDLVIRRSAAIGTVAHLAQTEATLSINSSNKDLSGNGGGGDKGGFISASTAFAVCVPSLAGGSPGGSNGLACEGAGAGTGPTTSSTAASTAAGFYPTKLFYGTNTNVHKSVIVSPSMWARASEAASAVSAPTAGSFLNANSAAVGNSTNQANINNGGIKSGSSSESHTIAGVDGATATAAATTEEVVSLHAIKSHETRKARRVQKAARCPAAGGAATKRSKS